MTDDEICRMVLQVMQEAFRMSAPEDQREPELDRIRSFCPPEARYDYEGEAA